MKMQCLLGLLFAGILLRAETVVIRQPGLFEALGEAAVGIAACTAEMGKGLICGSTTVIQVPSGNVAAVAPAAVIQRPVLITPAPVVAVPQVICPAVPLVPCGGYYSPCYRHYYGRHYYHHFHRPCHRPCYW